MAREIAPTRPICLWYDREENKFTSNSRVTREEATHMAVRMEDYVSVEDYKKLLQAYNQARANALGEDMVAIPKSEYNGLKKALRIIDDRALQQIDKSKTDEHGFRLLRADLTYNRELKGKLWLVTKETPYAAKLPLEEARALIERKLREIFYFTDEIDLQDYSDKPLDRFDHKIKGHKLCQIIKEWHEDDREYDFLGGNSDEGRALYKCWQEHASMIYEISKISVNYSQGLYEVSYWATEPI